MKKHKSWKDKLTKKDLKHLRENQDVLTLKSFKINRETQLKNEKKFSDESFRHNACFECRSIARKLNII